ncbi:MAG: hypothetical protein ISS87_00210 [Candidatus Pacebacteria bacterium]|nr:hypothetical protein [Candidatus Paceibacterota bacterium]
MNYVIENWPLEWYSTTFDALLDLWRGFLLSLPKALGGLIIFVVGWIVAVAVGNLVAQALEKLRFDQVFKKTGWVSAFKRAELDVNVSEFLGAIVKWMLVLVFLLASARVLGFVEFAFFLTKILAFLPNVIVAVLIFVVSVILSDILEKITVASVERAGVGYSRAAGLLVKWAILTFAMLAILVQLGIARQMIMTLFTGIIALIVISFGLAFGLGGKEIASQILKDLRDKLR